MSNNKNTPTPWSANLYHLKQMGGRTYAMIFGPDNNLPIGAILIGVERHSRDEGLGNARLLISAVNSHAALVEAMRDIIDIIDQGDTTEAWQTALLRGLAVLAAAAVS